MLGVIGILVIVRAERVVDLRLPVAQVGRDLGGVGRRPGLAPGQGHRPVRLGIRVVGDGSDDKLGRCATQLRGGLANATVPQGIDLALRQGRIPDRHVVQVAVQVAAARENGPC